MRTSAAALLALAVALASGSAMAFFLRPGGAPQPVAAAQWVDDAGNSWVDDAGNQWVSQ